MKNAVGSGFLERIGKEAANTVDRPDSDGRRAAQGDAPASPGHLATHL